jgi:hypothetical protein
MMTPLARYRAHVLFQPVADGGVLLDTQTEVYFGLNSVGARIWELLPRHATIESLCEGLAREFPAVPQDVLRVDVEELLGDLVGHGLLETPGTATEDAGVGSSSA